MIAFQIQNNCVMEHTFGYVKKAGFKYVSMGFGSSKADFIRDDWENFVEHIKNRLDENGLICVQTHLPYYDLLLSSEILEDEMELAIKRCIRASAMLGAKVCVYHPRSSLSRDFSVKASLVDNIKVISEYNEIAKEVGIGLALENLPVFPNIQHMRFYTHNYEDLCELVDAFDDENISVCWDFGHAHLTNFDHAKGLRFVGKRLSCTHVHNNFRDDDRHLHPSRGTMDWKTLMPILREIGYEGPLTAEVAYTENTMALESFVAHCYECMSHLESLI